MFILLLAQKGPRSFLSGNKIDLRKALKEYNRNEFHHIHPRSFLKGAKKSEIDDSSAWRICVFSPGRITTAYPGAHRSAYRKKLGDSIEDIEKANFLPPSTWDDVFEKFVENRSVLLTAYAAELLNGGTPPKKKKVA